MASPKPPEEPTLCEKCREQVNGKEDGDLCPECSWVFCYECLPPEFHGCET